MQRHVHIKNDFCAKGSTSLMFNCKPLHECTMQIQKWLFLGDYMRLASVFFSGFIFCAPGRRFSPWV